MVELVKLHEREVEMDGAKFQLRRLRDETRLRLAGRLKTHFRDAGPQVAEEEEKVMGLEEMAVLTVACTEALQEAMIGWSGVTSEGVEVQFDKKLVPELPLHIRVVLGEHAMDIVGLSVPKDLEGNSGG